MSTEINRDINEPSPQQKTAIECDSRAVMVVAGPGSGKTYTLTHAIEREVNNGVSPGNCLVVTFTRLAAHQMRTRLETMGITIPTIGTFHSICYYLIRTNWERLGFASAEIQVLDRVDQETLIKETLMQSRRSPSKTSVLKCLDTMASTFDYPEDLDPNVRIVVDSYLRRLKEYNAVDYPLVPYLGVSVAKDIGPGWTHLFVDECQDLDFSQWSLFKYCDVEKLFCVGDIDQGLYSWRGASAGLMREMAVEWKADIIKLEDNFRSGREIINRANKLIVHNKDRIPKVMVETRGYDGVVETLTMDDVVDKIMGHKQDGTLNASILGRTHRSLEEITGRLHASGLSPTIVSQRERLLERDDVKDLLAILAMPDLPYSAPVAERVWRCHGCTDIDVERMRSEARRSARSYVDTTACILDGLKELYSEFDGAALTERLQWVLHYTRNMPKASRFSHSDVGAIARIAAEFARQHTWKQRTGDRLLAWINMRDSQDDISETNDLQVMTIHASKGLEFSQVFIVGLDNWTLPIKAAHNKVDRMEEERRLMFVAMTRACDSLYLVLPDHHPSQFLAEVGISDEALA